MSAVKEVVRMKCGHSANGNEGGKPVCVICYPRNGWDEIDENPPSLEGRKARCSYCDKLVPSDAGLAFFVHRPHLPIDGYYCGCRGWN